MVDFKSIQDKWQKRWDDGKAFKVFEKPGKKKFYCMEMFPYPSAAFLHMGHVRTYTIGDSIARFKRMNGFNVLYPMGFDSFGLPAENASKKANIHPREYTENAISKIVEYMKALGLSYDWDRMIATHKPEYYKWNQYFFIKFFEKGLAYRAKASVNFCEHDNTVLANEEVVDGKCWRCDNPVVQKELDQWFLKTTAYADALLEDLNKLEWSSKIKAIQDNWIGKSEGVNIHFKLEKSSKILPAFTTRCDTIFSVTFIAIAPENPLIEELVKGTIYDEPVKKFIKNAIKEKSEDRINEDKEKEGIFIGKYAINPANNSRIPIYVANFALMYGTGIVMCDAHDKRDFRFARKYNIPLKFVISKDGKHIDPKDYDDAFTDDGVLFDSGKFNGMKNMNALPLIADWLDSNRFGKKTINYKLKDWLISRQRYWGTPIPMIHCDNCGVVPEKDLPVLLPDDVDFSKTGNPLLTSSSFKHVQCPICRSNARRETDTMGGFMDSSWYFLRYCSPDSRDKPFDKDAVNYWMPVDQYVGGLEHAVGHLIYSRFFVKVLRDMGMLDIDEPFNALFNQGVVHKDNQRMSKSHGNIVTQDEISNKYGIDTARMFMLSVSGPDKDMEWSDQGVEGTYKTLNRIYKLFEEHETYNNSQRKKDKHLISKKNIYVKKITDAINDFKQNNAVLYIIEFTNYLYDIKNDVSWEIFNDALKDLALLLNPFAPHLSEECFELITDAEYKFASLQPWPEYNESLIDYPLHYMEDVINNTVKDIYSVLELAKIDAPKNIDIIISDKWKYELLKMIIEYIGMSGKKNVPEIIKHVMSTDLKKHGQDIMKIVPKIVDKLPEFVIDQATEYNVFIEERVKFEEEFKCSINISLAENSNEAKAKQSMPGKPAIIVT